MQGGHKKVSKRKYMWLALGMLILVWGFLYYLQHRDLMRVLSYKGPTTEITGTITKRIHVGKKDFFDKVETKLQLNNGITYVIYTDEIPSVSEGDLVLVRVPSSYPTNRDSTIPAVSFEVIEKAPLNIKYKHDKN